MHMLMTVQIAKSLHNLIIPHQQYFFKRNTFYTSFFILNPIYCVQNKNGKWVELTVDIVYAIR